MKAKNPVFKTIGMALLGLLIILTACSNSSLPKDQLTIGAILPLTGWGAFWGEPVMKGMQLAEEEINSIYGDQSIDIIFEDGESSSTKVVMAANKLINANDADILYVEFSGFSSVVSPIAKENQKILVYSAFNQKIIEDNPLAIRSFINYQNACELLGKYMKNNNLKRVALINEYTDVAQYCINGLAVSIEPSNIILIDNIVDNDFRSILLKLDENKADIIVILMYENKALSLIKQNIELGLNLPIYCDKQDCATKPIQDAMGLENLEGNIYFEAVVSQEFNDKFIARFGETSSDDLQPAAFSYFATWAVFEAYNICSEKTNDCIIKEMEDIKVDESPFRNYRFKNRSLTGDLVFIKYQEGKEIRFDSLT